MTILLRIEKRSDFVKCSGIWSGGVKKLNVVILPATSMGGCGTPHHILTQMVKEVLHFCGRLANCTHFTIGT